MDSTVMPKTTEADHVLASRADERLAHAYEQIASADEQLARLTEKLTRMEQEAPRQPPVTPARKPSRGRPALRGFIGLLAAACIAGVAFISQSSYGEAAKPVIARWAAPYVDWWPQAKPELAGQPALSGVRLAAADATAAQATLPAQAGPQEAASPPALTPSELTQLLQTMARDLATLQQGIDQLKASQEQLASDNAKAVEEFRAGQEQMTRLVARISEEQQRARLPAPRSCWGNRSSKLPRFPSRRCRRPPSAAPANNRRRWRDDRYFTHTANTDRMPRIRHLDQNRFDHREVKARRHAVVKKSRVPHRTAVIIVVFFVERPADTLSDTTLDLPFDVTGMHRLANILSRRVTQDLDLASLRINLHIHNMGGEAGANATWVH